MRQITILLLVFILAFKVSASVSASVPTKQDSIKHPKLSVEQNAEYRSAYAKWANTPDDKFIIFNQEDTGVWCYGRTVNKSGDTITFAVKAHLVHAKPREKVYTEEGFWQYVSASEALKKEAIKPKEPPIKK